MSACMVNACWVLSYQFTNTDTVLIQFVSLITFSLLITLQA